MAFECSIIQSYLGYLFTYLLRTRHCSIPMATTVAKSVLLPSEGWLGWVGLGGWVKYKDCRAANSTITNRDLQGLPVLGTGYPVAITRVPGPGFNFWVSKENDNAISRTHPIAEYFSRIYVFFTLNVRKWMINQMWIRTSTKIVTIAANRGKSKSSHKEIQRQAKIAFFISNECKNRVSITRIWNRLGLA